MRNPPPAGQFYHGVDFEVSNQRSGEKGENINAILSVKGQTLNVTRYTRLTPWRHTWCRWCSECLGRLQMHTTHLFGLFPPTDTGRRTSAAMWKLGKLFPAGLWEITELASLMVVPRTTLCQGFSRPLFKLWKLLNLFCTRATSLYDSVCMWVWVAVRITNYMHTGTDI